MRPASAIDGAADGRALLTTAGICSAIAAILHLACILGGPDWYRFFGAGEGMAQAAERGDAFPAMITAGIAGVLAIWALYAFSGGGRIMRLPLLRTGLVVISAIYLVRGAMVLTPSLFNRPDLSAEFMLWSSLITLGFGLVYATGTWRAWPRLSKEEQG